MINSVRYTKSDRKPPPSLSVLYSLLFYFLFSRTFTRGGDIIIVITRTKTRGTTKGGTTFDRKEVVILVARPISHLEEQSRSSSLFVIPVYTHTHTCYNLYLLEYLLKSVYMCVCEHFQYRYVSAIRSIDDMASFIRSEGLMTCV